MDYRTLELNLAQLSKCIQKSKFNKYADKRKKVYQETLTQLFEDLKREDFSKISKPNLIEKKKIIDFIFESIQYLDNSTLTIIPFEIVYCLESALNEWIPNNKYIIVTSLSNVLSSYSVKGNLALHQPIYDLIKNDYKKEFEYKLIQITLPRYYVHDYLANVVLYHELGHFIDLKYQISNAIANDKVAAGEIVFKSVEHQTCIRYHMEHFADIFASQYIGEASNNFLNYVAYNAPPSPTHPATKDRIEKVINFLTSSSGDKIVNELMGYTNKKAGQDLKIRFNKLALDDFYSLIPFEIKNEAELHSIFNAGWEVWQESPNRLTKEFGNDIAYKIINNLIEKSISNYIVKTSWDKI